MPRSKGFKGQSGPHPCSWGWEAARAAWESPAWRLQPWRLQLWQPVGWPLARTATELCLHGFSQFRARVSWLAGTAGGELERLGTSHTQAAEGLVALGSRRWPLPGQGDIVWTRVIPGWGPALRSWCGRAQGKEQGMVGLIRRYPLSCCTAPVFHHRAPLLRTGLVHRWHWPKPVLNLLGLGGQAGRLR